MSEIGRVEPSSPSVGGGPTFDLPSLGADMEWGAVLEWRVEPGDEVRRGDIVALVATEKADIDVEIWQNGTVAELLAEVGQELPVGTPLLRLAAGAPAESDGGRPVPETVVSEPAVSEPVVSEPVLSEPVLSEPVLSEPVVSDRQVSLRASPLARLLAERGGLDLNTVVGSGPDGAIVARDVEALASDLDQLEAAPAEPAVVVAPAPKQDRAASMRRRIAERMTTANRDIPHYHLEMDVDLGDALAWLEQTNADRPIAERILPAALFVNATAQAARQHRELNGFWVDDRFEPADDVDVAMAISLRKGGLVTPVIGQADACSLSETMVALKERVAGARSGALRSGWMRDASITITNLGDNGADRVHGVIFPPQVALVGFGRVREQPWVVDGSVVPRPVVTVSLSADHRATDGATGSRFLATLVHHLEHPEEP